MKLWIDLANMAVRLVTSKNSGRQQRPVSQVEGQRFNISLPAVYILFIFSVLNDLLRIWL